MAITTNLMKPCYCLKISRRRATGMKYLMLLFWYLCFGFLKVLSTLASLDFVESPFKQQNYAVFGKLRHFSEYFLLSTTTTPMPSFFIFFNCDVFSVCQNVSGSLKLIWLFYMALFFSLFLKWKKSTLNKKMQSLKSKLFNQTENYY